ncbi:DUF1127 domain-containing protein [Marivita hallyeonensis]|uniref:YjiS-like domain-containing protein n=1 Tax=Marivita hallyeonensis TaxID=996342 RepID=A0A1M5P9N6_9RHOB|nr:DUF1127 domain-containing protein [Marivita hallyeonensis]SHG98462.1 protein of unknown function [Marivita hallyeonensis]
MTHLNLTHTASYRGLSDRIAGFVADLRAKLARRKVYRETLRELRTLDARELADLGLNPSMLKRIAYQAAYET